MPASGKGSTRSFTPLGIWLQSLPCFERLNLVCAGRTRRRSTIGSAATRRASWTLSSWVRGRSMRHSVHSAQWQRPRVTVMRLQMSLPADRVRVHLTLRNWRVRRRRTCDGDRAVHHPAVLPAFPAI